MGKANEIRCGGDEKWVQLKLFGETAEETAEEREAWKQVEEKAKSALNTQVEGDWYKNMTIQPVEFIHANNLDFLQGNVVKYISRYKNKNGAADVKKALHYCQLILELQYDEKS